MLPRPRYLLCVSSLRLSRFPPPFPSLHFPQCTRLSLSFPLSHPQPCLFRLACGLRQSAGFNMKPVLDVRGFASGTTLHGTVSRGVIACARWRRLASPSSRGRRDQPPLGTSCLSVTLSLSASRLAYARIVASERQPDKPDMHNQPPPFAPPQPRGRVTYAQKPRSLRVSSMRVLRSDSGYRQRYKPRALALVRSFNVGSIRPQRDFERSDGRLRGLAYFKVKVPMIGRLRAAPGSSVYQLFENIYFF